MKTLSLFCATAVACTASLHADYLYVAPDGDDNSLTPADPATPYRTIQQAASVAQAGQTVVIREGVYRENVIPTNSGTVDAPIIFRPYEGEAVTVSGTEDLLAMATADAWEVWKADILGSGDNIYVLRGLDWVLDTSTNQDYQLFYNGKMMIEARFPNIPEEADLDPMLSKWINIDEAGRRIFLDDTWESGKYEYAFSDAEFVNLTDFEGSPLDLTGMTLWFQPRHIGEERWGLTASGEISSYNPTTGEVRFISAGYLDTFQTGNPVYVGKALGLLDTPGEWFYDEGNNDLYFYPPDGIDPTGDLVEGKVRDYAFQLHDGGLEDGFRSYITIEDLHIFGALITTDTAADNGVGNGNSWVGRNTGFWQQPQANSHRVVLQRLHFQYISHGTDGTGHNSFQWEQTGGVTLSGFDHVIRDSIIEFSASQGILVLGHRNLVENNLVHSIGYQGPYGAAIGVAQDSWDNTIRHNTIWRTGNNAIRTEDNRSSGDPAHPAEVAYNRIQAYGMITEDVGGIKDVGGQEHEEYDFYASWHHNVISHGAADDYGLYLDFVRNHSVYNNVVYDNFRPININNGINHQIYHNTLFGYAADQVHFSGLSSITGNDIRNNIVSGTIATEITPGNNTLLSNYADAPDQIFFDPVGGDFRLVAPLAIAAVEIPAAFAEPQIGESREIGALEIDGEGWLETVGASLPPLWEAPDSLTVARNELNEAVLSWQDNASNETLYFVERATERADGDRLWEVIAKLPADSNEWVDVASKDKINLPIHYRVRANHSLYAPTFSLFPIPEGLHYNFEGNLKDHVLLPDDGIFLQGSTAGEAQFSAEAALGSRSLALQASERGRIEVANSLEISPAKELTLAVWIRPNSWPRSVTLFDKEDAYTLSHVLGQLRLKLGNGGRTAVLDPDDLPVENWYHLTFTFDGSILTTYLNGERQGSEILRPRELVSATPLYIGGPAQDADDLLRYFDGLIDDFRVYHRALSSAEIEDLYAGIALTDGSWNETLFGWVYALAGSDWSYSPIFDYLVLDRPWTYQHKLGWLFVLPAEANAYWLYSPSVGWLYTNTSFDGWYTYFDGSDWVYGSFFE